jgi:hypothetical protein
MKKSMDLKEANEYKNWLFFLMENETKTSFKSLLVISFKENPPLVIVLHNCKL